MSPPDPRPWAARVRCRVFLDIDDGLGGRQLAAQPLVLLGELGHTPGLGEGESALRPCFCGSSPARSVAARCFRHVASCEE